MKQVICPLCNEKTEILFAKTIDRQFKSENNKEYVSYKCNKCDIVFQFPFPDIQDFDKIYPLNYYAHSKSKKIPFNLKLLDYFLSHKKIIYLIKEIRQFLFPYFLLIRNSSNVLDIGCGKGLLLDILKKSGKNTYGVEMDSSAAEIAEKSGHTIYRGNLVNSKFSKGQFDIITMFQVFEHLENPIESVGEIFRILKPGGSLILEVPNHDSSLAKKHGKNWRGLELPRHLIIYSSKSLSKLLELNGFEDLRSFVRHAPSDIWGTARLSSQESNGFNFFSIVPYSVFNKIVFPYVLLKSMKSNNQGSLLTIIAKKKEI